MTTNLQSADDEVEEEGDDGEQVHQVHGRTEELELPGGAGETDLEKKRNVNMCCLIKGLDFGRTLCSYIIGLSIHKSSAIFPNVKSLLFKELTLPCC